MNDHESHIAGTLQSSAETLVAEHENEQNDLTATEIVLIVIGSVAGVVLLFAFLYYIFTRNKQSPQPIRLAPSLDALFQAYIDYSITVYRLVTEGYAEMRGLPGTTFDSALLESLIRKIHRGARDSESAVIPFVAGKLSRMVDVLNNNRANGASGAKLDLIHQCNSIVMSWLENPMFYEIYSGVANIIDTKVGKIMNLCLYTIPIVSGKFRDDTVQLIANEIGVEYDALFEGYEIQEPGDSEVEDNFLAYLKALEKDIENTQPGQSLATSAREKLPDIHAGSRN